MEKVQSAIESLVVKACTTAEAYLDTNPDTAVNIINSVSCLATQVTVPLKVLAERVESNGVGIQYLKEYLELLNGKPDGAQRGIVNSNE